MMASGGKCCGRKQSSEVVERKIGSEPRLPGALFDFFNQHFKKKLKKYKDVVNYIH
jgi:hypothetical protein